MRWIKLKIMKNVTFFKFLLVGVINTGVGLTSIFVLFNVLHLNYWTSTSLGNVIGMICSYILNKKFTFQSKKSTNQTLWIFLLISIVCYFLSYYLGYLFNLIIDQSGEMSHSKLVGNVSILLASGLYTIFNYIGHRYFTFSEK